MAIYKITAERIRPIDPTTFDRHGLRERADLQRLLRSQIEIVAPDTLIIAEEFCEWEDSRRRVDLLGLDKNANLVVFELKRTEDGGHMELQAVRYAAMVSAMTFDQAVEVYTHYLASIGSPMDARTSILDFLGWPEPDEDQFAQDVRIVLISAEFSKELTTAVIWLNDHELDIRCVRIKPYADGDRVLIDVQQVIPLPEAAEYQVRLRQKESRERTARREHSELAGLYRRFWTSLLERARGRTELHAGISPSNKHWVSKKRGMFLFNYVAAGTNAPRAELYIGGSQQASKAAFDRLMQSKAEIEGRFGGPLRWERLDDKNASRVRAEVHQGSLEDESTWPDLQDAMIDTMIRLECCLSPHLVGSDDAPSAPPE